MDTTVVRRECVCDPTLVLTPAARAKPTVGRDRRRMSLTGALGFLFTTNGRLRTQFRPHTASSSKGARICLRFHDVDVRCARPRASLIERGGAARTLKRYSTYAPTLAQASLGVA